MDYFIAVDVETANRSRGSICQIGLVCFSNDDIEWQWSTLVNPEVAFDPWNTRIHGITPQMVAAAPTWPVVLDRIADSLRGQIVASHSNFDEHALAEASRRYGRDTPPSRWIDSHAMARRSWPELARHGLGELCATFNIELNHHDALSDAMACGRIVRLCLETSRMTAEDRKQQRLALSSQRQPRARAAPAGYQSDVAVDANLEGPLSGHVVVLTGEFEGGKGPLAHLAAAAGCTVAANFAKSRTTVLVVGHRDPQLWGDLKSGKHRQAEAAIAEGRNIRIMTEHEFRGFLDNAVSSAPLETAL